MSKFKVGDRVRRINYYFDGMAVGDQSTVELVKGSMVCLAGYSGLHDVDNLELVASAAPAGPIRTVTRREIVPGEYGMVEVLSAGRNLINIKAGGLQSAEALREAAHLFNQFAEVLEENTKADAPFMVAA